MEIVTLLSNVVELTFVTCRVNTYDRKMKKLIISADFKINRVFMRRRMKSRELVTRVPVVPRASANLSLISIS